MVDWIKDEPKLHSKLKKIWRLYHRNIIRSLFILAVFLFFLTRSTRQRAYPSSTIKPPSDPTPSSQLLTYDTNKPFDYNTYIAYLTSHNQLTSLSNTSSLHSSYKCLGKQNLLSAHDRRACLFRNICYNKPTKEWTFHQSTQKPVFYDMRSGPEFSFGVDFINMAALWFFPTYFTPIVKVGVFPEKKRMIKGLNVLWTTNLQDFNFGHFVYEELGSVYYTLARFALLDRNPRILYLKPNPRNHLFSKFIAGFLPALTSEPLAYFDELVNAYTEENVCFEKIVVGGYARMFYGYLDEFNEGKETLLRGYRDAVLTHYKIATGALEIRPRKHKILVNVKSDSVYLVKQGRTRFRVIVNAQQLVDHLAKRYPGIQVVQVNLSKLSIEAQIREMQSVTIFISHPGGSCMILPFIPTSSHALLIDYYATDKDGMFGYQTGDSVSMEVSFWNLWPHFEKVYYQIYGRDEMEWDSQALKDAEENEKIVKDEKKRGNGVEGGWLRDDASVVVDLQRVEFLINEMMLTHVF